MDITVENNPCKNIFASDASKIRERFTDLWIQVINEKENHAGEMSRVFENRDMQTNIL